MKRCQSCGKNNYESARFCDECGTKLVDTSAVGTPQAAKVEQAAISGSYSANITSIGLGSLAEPTKAEQVEPIADVSSGHSSLVIERGESSNTSFFLTAEESFIGRWDADNGIFPDVDLDAHDPDAKVSRRHARILHRGGGFMIEDLGSTNGTFVNRGRRLLPGNPHSLKEGDEIIVGKTFLRFLINKKGS